eukprot:m.1461897 g.1461897  ORF g.1461897 m.1461897 type:complete len:65 (+) comp25133_c2_seq7:4978-5172(+)
MPPTARLSSGCRALESTVECLAPPSADALATWRVIRHRNVLTSLFLEQSSLTSICDVVGYDVTH